MKILTWIKDFLSRVERTIQLKEILNKLPGTPPQKPYQEMSSDEFYDFILAGGSQTDYYDFLLNFLLTGYAADWLLALLNELIHKTLVIQIVSLTAGLVVLCIAISAMITCNLGIAAYDAVSLIIEKRTPLSYRISRIITDSVCVIAGFLLGAKLGIATVIAALCMGPFINWANIYISNPFLKWAGKTSDLQ